MAFLYRFSGINIPIWGDQPWILFGVSFGAGVGATWGILMSGLWKEAAVHGHTPMSCATELGE